MTLVVYIYLYINLISRTVSWRNLRVNLGKQCCCYSNKQGPHKWNTNELTSLHFLINTFHLKSSFAVQHHSSPEFQLPYRHGLTESSIYATYLQSESNSHNIKHHFFLGLPIKHFPPSFITKISAIWC
jgi:hypothetical protein